VTGDLAARAARLADDAHRDLWTLVVEAASVLHETNPVTRRPWLVDLLDKMFKEQDGLCALCGVPMQRNGTEVDHVVPFCYGGGNERGNIQLAHGLCNRSKRASVDVHVLLRYLEDRWMNR
jgi:hypothetical protein